MSERGFTKGTFPNESEGSQPEHGLWWGVVTSRKDPEKRGRVRVRIPGLNNVETTWAEPVGGVAGGGSKVGFKGTPRVGANVLVGFIQGDVDEPVFWPGPFPIGQVPERGDDPDNVVLETENFRFLVLESDGVPKLRIENKIASPAQSYIEMTMSGGEGKSHVVTIHGATAVALTSSGAITLDAPVVQIKGRTVDPSPKPI